MSDDPRFRRYFTQQEVEDALVWGLAMGVIIGGVIASVIWWAAT